MITLAHLLDAFGGACSHVVGGRHIPQSQERAAAADVHRVAAAGRELNFVAFSRYLGQLDGQIFVFFVLTVAAAESAIGLAILVVLFRERRSINVEELDQLQG